MSHAGRNVSADAAVKVSVLSLICGLLRHEVQGYHLHGPIPDKPIPDQLIN